ncbi:MAG: exopolyphosphatase / guanosine-5-triphosphate,3-diphosphate pyrophosphatase [Tenuifilum sp.]|jgi:exopolyphosphatase/guanosine-5'-triphosphate,3'-diphosphate pyrophosphatase|uniref:Ppx/GppA phosphatase family protein n=1 Tax=Tenuifilum sp. TaxID=2760880 RepID=UPI0024AB59A5|nr:Ppx/GppA family phosphatase [Tenuifilum sp.]MDI3525863.1 exopolyphosphatase / guanosine-5-triphosphate,3-diphosphate pyrophosphatase [Tenuifilum sp.]
MRVLKFAAIDIGSNAARLLLSNVVEDGEDVIFKKSSLVRVPIRLGEDAFSKGYISELRSEKLVKTMIAFKNLMEVNDVVMYKACATSAMRSSSNSKELVERVKEIADIDIEIIDGRREAEIIFANGVAELLDGNSSYMYVDVGGGSTELTLFEDGKAKAASSFNIGTIRMLKKTIGKSDFDSLKEWVKKNIDKSAKPKIIGSGGNINKLYKMAKKTNLEPLSNKEIKNLYEFVSSYTLEDRIKILGLNPDRADVIIPATKIFLKLMKWSGAKEIIVPTIGISDGIVRTLYRDFKNSSK